MSKKIEQVQAVNRGDTEPDITKRSDRVEKYLKSYLKDFVFDELSDAFLDKAGAKEFMAGVPIPLRRSCIEQFQDGEGLKTTEIAENMIWIIGINPTFRYAEHYITFLVSLYHADVLEGLLLEGRDAAEKGEFDKACIYFRACLRMKPDYLDGMYSYARVCRDMYLEGGDEDYIGNLKAEAIDYFELVTEKEPEFAEAYYYLGYAYANLGLYIKADITWKQFLDKTMDLKQKSEIKERMQQLEGPVKIEAGCNDILSGRYEDGIIKLQHYRDSSFKTWWPLFYYLGVAYSRVGDLKEAEQCFKTVLTLQPSHVDTMEELAAIYEITDDQENKEKYLQKIELIRSQITQH
ncbi:tetratricopeptide repeat protein [Aminipila luticellarii]|uniref:Tetratricopeptide repeat protein n=1 Tax=Aminipila luticellarii TaxID=2507160 RepID=A0A410PWH6_9FIRM|nr:tetratricopeptide repeat protein [Aminipila luticellarii]QAT43292.1 tetratricopeptide repeat protein [Aminipila luticellarii]